MIVNYQNKMIVILDANAFFSSKTLTEEEDSTYYTTSLVEEEILKNQQAGFLFHSLVEQNMLIVYDPQDKFMIEAVMTAKETGDSHVLSENDISIIALALELKKEDVDQIAVISSDFAVQNVCKKLNIRYESFKNGTIKKQIMWSYMCLSCRAIFKQMPPDEECETCGGEVVRKSGTKKKKKN